MHCLSDDLHLWRSCADDFVHGVWLTYKKTCFESYIWYLTWELNILQKSLNRVFGDFLQTILRPRQNLDTLTVSLKLWQLIKGKVTVQRKSKSQRPILHCALCCLPSASSTKCHYDSHVCPAVCPTAVGWRDKARARRGSGRRHISHKETCVTFTRHNFQQ